MGILNSEDKDYYEGRLWKVNIWSGMGYSTYTYNIYAGNAEEALNLAVKYAEIEDDPVLFCYRDIEEEFETIAEEGEDIEDYIDTKYIYVDGTMDGAYEPWFVLAENLRIEEVR